ncbi:hypothetical protein SAMN06297129_3536 [Pseudooceanicola antarcticus]|uniref:Uncharacterized protein n=1 Tax=Pseudooceanicola antarcticus TaxID=1247613 RepID=A0A285JD33_9RHOB|nr:hypothetical protein [Pseudooceanicola antarcticus]PJE31350.1 hypothetical protein CVM39_03845 [Pseudooceanicola antarcticus]SNY58178.1 hypothetical protein SAMN06297129_3536 [Pseudooceanicola antarcticus]
MALRDIIKHIEGHPGGAAGWTSFFGRRPDGVTVFLPTGEDVSHLDLLAVRNRFSPAKVELSPAAKARALRAVDRND